MTLRTFFSFLLSLALDRSQSLFFSLSFVSFLFISVVLLYIAKFVDVTINLSLRWLDWIFLGRYLPSLSLNYFGMSKDIETRLPQLYYMKMKISYDLGFIAIGVARAT